MSQAKTFQCPSCGAALEFVDAPTVTCKYCGVSVVVPAELRSKPVERHPQPITVIKVNTAWSGVSRGCLVTMLIAFLVLIGISVASVFLIGPTTSAIFSQVKQQINNDNGIPQVISTLQVDFTSTVAPGDVSDLASFKLAFGNKGREAGQLDDARYIAVAPDGNIFTADYSSGRVQKFDAQGAVKGLIQVPSSRGDDDVIILGMIIDPNGTLYIAREGEILRFNTQDGALLGVIESGWPEYSFESLAFADGVLYSTSGMAAADEIIRLSPEGELLSRWQEMINQVEDDDSAIGLEIAVHPEGSIYLLSPMSNQVYIFDAEGEFTGRFGEAGNSPGQFGSLPNDIAFGPDGQIYIAESYRISEYDAQGNYTDRSLDIQFDTAGGVIRSIAVDQASNLYAVTNGGKVLVYELKK